MSASDKPKQFVSESCFDLLNAAKLLLDSAKADPLITDSEGQGMAVKQTLLQLGKAVEEVKKNGAWDEDGCPLAPPEASQDNDDGDYSPMICNFDSESLPQIVEYLEDAKMLLRDFFRPSLDDTDKQWAPLMVGTTVAIALSHIRDDQMEMHMRNRSDMRRLIIAIERLADIKTQTAL